MEYKKRVIVEAFELLEKLIKLRSFTQSEQFSKLNDEDQKLMIEQNQVMTNYYEILRIRIDRFFN